MSDILFEHRNITQKTKLISDKFEIKNTKVPSVSL